jgi:hypothetical protein
MMSGVEKPMKKVVEPEVEEPKKKKVKPLDET